MTCEEKECDGCCAIDDVAQEEQQDFSGQQEQGDHAADFDKTRTMRMASLEKIDKVLKNSGLKGTLSRGDIGKISRELRNLAATHEGVFQGLMTDIINFAQAVQKQFDAMSMDIAMAHLGALTCQKLMVDKGLITDEEFQNKFKELGKEMTEATKEPVKATEGIASDTETVKSE